MESLDILSETHVLHRNKMAKPKQLSEDALERLFDSSDVVVINDAGKTLMVATSACSKPSTVKGGYTARMCVPTPAGFSDLYVADLLAARVVDKKLVLVDGTEVQFGTWSPNAITV